MTSPTSLVWPSPAREASERRVKALEANVPELNDPRRAVAKLERFTPSERMPRR
jgi:hypothetical protein